MSVQHVYEITVIGGGPVGMFASFYAGLRQADVLLLESLDELGGQTGNLYPAKILYDIGGFPHVSGKDLVTQLKTQLVHFHPEVKTATEVQTIDQDPDGFFTLHTSQGDFRSKTVIVATGGGAFTPRKLAVDYDPALEGKKLFYFVQDLETFRDQEVAVAGGGDSAIDWALALEPVAKHVSLIHRRAKFRGLEASVAALEKSSVTIQTPYLIESVTPQDDQLAIQLKEVRGEAQPTLTVDKLLINYGFVTDKHHLQAWQLDTDRNGILVDTQMQTSRPGIFAIGDAVSYAGKLPLIASGFGEAPTAINEALSRLYPDRRQALHSTQLYH